MDTLQVTTRGTLRLMACVALLMPALPSFAQPMPERARPEAKLQVYAYTLKHQQADQALAQIQSLLSADGTVEIQPGGNTLVIRDHRANIELVSSVLKRFDDPPENLRFDIRILRAGPRRSVISPPVAGGSGVPEELLNKLRRYLNFEDYQVLAKAPITSREGGDVTYEMGRAYEVSFRPGTVMTGTKGQRLRLEEFRIQKNAENPTNKGRRLGPEELFNATVNLWIDQPFILILDQDVSRQEALLIAIFCQRESGDESVSQQ